MEHVRANSDATDCSSTGLLYCVERPVYNEEEIQGHLLHQRRSKGPPLSQRLARHFRCSAQRLKLIVISFVPILTWLPSYPVKEYLFGDVVSGISTGVMQLPQGLAYAMLAAVPPVYGLYTSFYPVLLYTFFGTSRHTSVGTFAVISLMIGAVAIREAPDTMFWTQSLNSTNSTGALDREARDARRVQIAVALTWLVGVIQLAFGLLRFGFVSIYLTEPLVRGFTTAAAVHVFVSQLKYLLGVSTPRFGGPLSVIYSVWSVLMGLADTNLPSFLLGLICIVLLYAIKYINDRYRHRLLLPIPGEIILVIVSTGVSYGMELSKDYKVDVVGKIPTGLLPPALPDFSILPSVFTDSIAIAVVGFSMSISLAKIFALKHGYSVDGSQELIALGICNFTGSFFHCFCVTSSMSRSLVQESTGGKTQVAGLLASLMVLLVVVAIGFVFQPLPQTVLAAVIMVNLLGMFKQLADIPALWRSSQIELAIWLVAFLASVLLGLDYGLLVAIGFAILTVLYRTQSPKTMILGQIPNTDLYCDTEEYEEANEYAGIKIFHSNMPLYFANSDLYINALKQKSGVNPALLLAARKSHHRQVRQWQEEKQRKAEPTKREAVVTLDMSRGVTHTLMGETMLQQLKQTNGQATVVLDESDQDESFTLLEPLSEVHSIILDFTPVNFVDSVGAKAIRSVIREYATVEVQVFLAGCSRTLLADLRKLKFFDAMVTLDLVFPTVHDAVLHCQHRARMLSAMRCTQC